MPRINFELTKSETEALMRGEVVSLGKIGEYRDVTITTKKESVPEVPYRNPPYMDCRYAPFLEKD